MAADKLLGELKFDYDGAIIPAGRTTPLAVSTELGLVIRRDPRTESSADIKLFELGFREAKDPRADPGTLRLPGQADRTSHQGPGAGRLAGRGGG